MVFSIILFFAFAVVLYLLARPVVSGAMYVPTPHAVVEKIVELAGITPGQKIADIGSGDGRIVIALARAGADATGYEINPLLVFLSRHRIAKTGLSKNARVFWRSFWKEDFSRFDAAIVYGYPPIMKKLGAKLMGEMKSGAKVIASVSAFPNWTPAESHKVGRYIIRLYIKTPRF